MEAQSSSKAQTHIVRQLASLKLLSRLLGHELHAQGSSKTITLTREEVSEIQATIDLFIEEISRRQGQTSSFTATGAPETHLVGSRN